MLKTRYEKCLQHKLNRGCFYYTHFSSVQARSNANSAWEGMRNYISGIRCFKCLWNVQTYLLLLLLFLWQTPMSLECKLYIGRNMKFILILKCDSRRHCIQLYNLFIAHSRTNNPHGSDCSCPNRVWIQNSSYYYCYFCFIFHDKRE